jgi:hypothetical protein
MEMQLKMLSNLEKNRKQKFIFECICFLFEKSGLKSVFPFQKVPTHAQLLLNKKS